MGFECRISVGKLSYKNRAISYYNAIIFADVKEPLALSQTISYIASIVPAGLRLWFELRVTPNVAAAASGVA
jgi:hypothetical protein